MEKNLILCGFMGSGKTTVGKRLARLLSKPFVDMDEYIALSSGRTIAALFEERGEAGFRALEQEACHALGATGGQIIATGGGALLFARNVRVLKKNGVILFLHVEPDTVKRRLSGDDTRPLLNRPDRDSAMETLYAARVPLYRQSADHEFKADGTPEAVAKSIVKWLSEGEISVFL